MRGASSASKRVKLRSRGKLAGLAERAANLAHDGGGAAGALGDVHLGRLAVAQQLELDQGVTPRGVALDALAGRVHYLLAPAAKAEPLAALLGPTVGALGRLGPVLVADGDATLLTSPLLVGHEFLRVSCCVREGCRWGTARNTAS